VVVTSPEGISVATARTRLGQTLSVTDGLGNVTRFEYDKNGATIAVNTPLSRSTKSYDHAGRLVDTTDANGNRVHLDYDAANRVLSRSVDPLGLNLVTRYAYSAKGQQLSVTDPNGNVTQYEYNVKGELIQQIVDPTRPLDGHVGLNLITQYSFDGAGNTLKVTDPNGTATTYAYDNLGRSA
jgi:YD repeat-containing protein